MPSFLIQKKVKTLILLLLPFTSVYGNAAETVNPESVIDKAIQELANLKEGDEEGFHTQADILLKGGERALDAIQAELKKSPEAKAFRLKRLQDMFFYPKDIKGVITKEMSKKFRYDLGAQSIIISYNDIPTPNIEAYEKTVKKFDSVRDKHEAKVTALVAGRKKTFDLIDQGLGYYIQDYPNGIEYYVHEGQRDLKWDECAIEGLKSHAIEHWLEATEKLKTALQKGCRDAQILACAMNASIESNLPDDALKLCKIYRPSIRQRKGEKSVCWVEMLTGKALLYTGDQDAAAAQLAPFDHCEDNTASYVRTFLALAIQDKDPNKAVALLQEVHSKYSWAVADGCLYELLKKLGRYEEASAIESIQNKRGRREMATWMTTFKAHAKIPKPAHWALVYCNDFADPRGALRFSNHHPDRMLSDYAIPREGALVALGPYASITNWEFYKNVKIDIDVCLESYSKYLGTRVVLPGYSRINPEVTISAAFNQARGDQVEFFEIGFGYNISRRLITLVHFDGHGYLGFLPTTDPGIPHHLTLECYEGRAQFFIDGKRISEQFYPKDWFGRINLRTLGAVKFDNLELCVPSNTPPENDKIRQHYKNASDAIVKGELAAALEALERAAQLQAPNDDLDRLYAAYIESKATKNEWVKLLQQRMRSASELKVVAMLVGAETALSYFMLSPDAASYAQDVYIRRCANVKFIPKYYEPVRAAKDLANLSIYGDTMVLKLQQKQTTFELAEAALKNTLESCPESIAPIYHLAYFYFNQKRYDLAQPVFKQLKAKLPNAKFLDEILDSITKGSKAQPPKRPPEEDF